jgi:4-hydroxy-tetrahydrodipicolinate synthase
MPVLAYNIPDRSGVDLTPDVVKRIAERCENFIGLKDSAGRLDELPELLSIGAARPFAVLIGRDHMILEALRRGAAGAVTACANVAPRLFVDLYRAFRADNLPEAARLQALVDPLRQTFALHTFPAVIKEAMGMIGYPAGPCRRPVGPMPDEARKALAAALQKLRDEHYLPENAASVRA